MSHLYIAVEYAFYNSQMLAVNAAKIVEINAMISKPSYTM